MSCSAPSLVGITGAGGIVAEERSPGVEEGVRMGGSIPRPRRRRLLSWPDIDVPDLGLRQPTCSVRRYGVRRPQRRIQGHSAPSISRRQRSTLPSTTAFQATVTRFQSSRTKNRKIIFLALPHGIQKRMRRGVTSANKKPSRPPKSILGLTAANLIDRNCEPHCVRDNTSGGASSVPQLAFEGTVRD
ncbi:hypothetical protein BHM03_00062394 [Ensete ventricosum]|nr:hypothetical protein BHM03_00062394 [Ensete ventricosum]